MLKIVEVHAAASAQGEYIVLQNQGLMTVGLKGWALCTDAYLSGDAQRMAGQMFVFLDDVPIKPYTRIVLFTGRGENGWVPTVDGRHAYCVYWGRAERIWAHTENIHVLHLFASKRVTPYGVQPTPSTAVTA